MAKLSQIVDALAGAIWWEPGEVRHFARRAREGGELTSTGARGNAAPDATSRDAASLIIAVAAATYAKDAARVIKDYRRFSLAKKPDGKGRVFHHIDAAWVPVKEAEAHGYSQYVPGFDFSAKTY
ncbi:hypothetical protein, partial [Arenibaculum sp.]|uniref:hypothetical protein n=1 Tax=Arenibaculum sp. TaxID=2865862 RepID=UPI002E119C8C|nr:hypothetical protein [Arenibaculum sp.]